MAKVTVNLTPLNKGKGEIMDQAFFSTIQANCEELKSKTAEVNQFEPLDHIEPVISGTNAATITTEINKLLADLKAKGYMKN